MPPSRVFRARGAQSWLRAQLLSLSLSRCFAGRLVSFLLVLVLPLLLFLLLHPRNRPSLLSSSRGELSPGREGFMDFQGDSFKIGLRATLSYGRFPRDFRMPVAGRDRYSIRRLRREANDSRRLGQRLLRFFGQVAEDRGSVVLRIVSDESRRYY